jgi:hypothetical protein
MFDLKKFIGLILLSVITSGAHATLTLPTPDLSWSWEREVHKLSAPPNKVEVKSYKGQKLSQTEDDESRYQLICVR